MKILCVAGPSGSGKTTLLERLLPLLPVPRDRVGLLKHTHHRLDWHPPEKDSTRMWASGVGAVGVVDPDQGAFFVRRGSGPAAGRGVEDAPGTGTRPAWTTLELVTACRRLPGSIELVLAEGWSRAAAPKLWVVDRAPGSDDAEPPPFIRAVVTAAERVEAWREGTGVPVFSRDEPEAVAAMLPGWTVALAELPIAGPEG